jgi:hypothetical protein
MIVGSNSGEQLVTTSHRPRLGFYVQNLFGYNLWFMLFLNSWKHSVFQLVFCGQFISARLRTPNLKFFTVADIEYFIILLHSVSWFLTLLTFIYSKVLSNLAFESAPQTGLLNRPVTVGIAAVLFGDCS